MPVQQNQQVTLEMVLKAQDQASTAIQAVGRELAQMTSGAKVGDLSVGLRESLAKVNNELRENAESLIQIEHNEASRRLQEARTTRETMARDTRAFFEQEKQALRANLAAETELWREAEREQVAIAREAMRQRLAAGEDPRLVRADTATAIRDARRQRVGAVADSRSQSQDEMALTQANKEASLDVVRDLYEKRARIVKNRLSDEKQTIEQYLEDNVRAQRSYGNTILSASRELGREQTRLARETASEQTRIAREAARDAARVQREAAQEQERIARQLARDEQRIARERAAKAREPGIIGHGAEGLMNIVQQSLVWNAAYQVAGKINETIGSMASGMLSVNVQLEQFQATFSSIYQNKDKGAQAVKWLTDLAVQLPATREQTIQAGLTIASLGDNITDVMMPLANIASVMHVELPRAAQAFADAQEGRFQMLQTTLHITKKELEDYGLRLDSNNRVLNNSFIPAFEKLGRVRFAGAAADQMKTLGGAVSNLQDVFAKLQARLGHGIFKALEDNLGRLLVMLNNPALAHFAEVLGNQMGHALSRVIGNIEKWVQQMGGIPGLVTHINVVIHGASQVLMGLWGAFSNVGFVIKTVSDLISPLLGLIAKLSGAADTDSSRLKILVQVATDLFIAWKVLGPIITLVTAAMEKQKLATIAATEAEVTCKTATMDLSLVLGENGLTSTAGTAGNALSGTAGAMGKAATAATVFGSRLGGMAGFLTSTIGRIGLLTADLFLLAKAWEQIQTFGTSTQQKQQLLDYGKELAPVKGSESTLGHLLWRGPKSGQGGAAYIAFGNMLFGRTSEDRAGGTKLFLDALQNDPALMQTYTRYMTGQGAGARVQKVLSGYTGMVGAGGGLINAQQQQDAQNYQAYQSALNMFHAELRTRPADAAGQLGAVVDAYQTWKLGSQTSQGADEAAINAANQLQAQLNAQLPSQYRLQSTTTDLSQKGSQGKSPTDKLAAAKKALAQFRAHQWADTLRKIGLGTIDQADVQSIIDQLRQDEQAAGVVFSDTDTMNRVRAATKTYVATLSRRFDVIMGKLRDHVKGFTADMASAVLNKIQQTELSVGLDDTTGLQQRRLERWTAPAGSGGPIMAGSAAADQVGYLRTNLGDAKAHLAALAKKTPGATQAIQDLIDQIAGPGGLVEQYDRARNIPWPQTLKDEDTARTRLTSTYLGLHKTSHALADAHSQLTIDLNTLGRSTKDYNTLMADARRIQKDDFAAHHDKTHALAAYTVAHKAVMAHMKHTGEAGGVSVPTPLYGPYRVVTPQYGATQVSFGSQQHNTMAALVQHLQALVAYWMHRARRDEDALRAQQETAQNTRSLRGFQGWSHNAQVPAPAAPASAGAFVRARGGFNIFRRP